jgi:hypothetical protein
LIYIFLIRKFERIVVLVTFSTTICGKFNNDKAQSKDQKTSLTRTS